MWRVPRPKSTVEHALTRCSTFGNDVDINSRLRASGPEMAKASLLYEAAAIAGDLHALDAEQFALKWVTRGEMVNIYDGRFVGGAGRRIYDEIRAGAPGDRCPMCGIRDVAQVDHNLPKS